MWLQAALTGHRLQLANVAFHHDRRMYLSADASRATDHPEA
jgi:hypothetical protein